MATIGVPVPIPIVTVPVGQQEVVAPVAVPLGTASVTLILLRNSGSIPIAGTPGIAISWTLEWSSDSITWNFLQSGIFDPGSAVDFMMGPQLFPGENFIRATINNTGVTFTTSGSITFN